VYRQSTIKLTALICALSTTSGCMDAGMDAVSRAPDALFGLFGGDADQSPATQNAVLDPTMENGAQSDIINGLLNRRSMLGAGPFTHVEVAAVTLSQDTNKRVLTALELYLTAQAAKARADVNAAAMERMTHFEYVMSERVKGGVSSRVELQIVQQKLNQMQNCWPNP